MTAYAAIVRVPAARAATTLPGAGDPSRQVEIGMPLTEAMDSDEYDLPAARARALAQMPAELAGVHFKLNGIAVEGATAYSQEDMAALYADRLGKDITAADLYQILQALQQKYLDDGFTFTKVSMEKQDFAGGHIVFRVVEGFVGEVEFEKPPRPGRMVDDAVARIKAMRPLNVRKLERLVLILNDLPDLHLGAVIAPPSAKAGAHPAPGELRIVFRELPPSEHPGHGVITLDNTGSRYVGPWRMGVQGALRNIGQEYNRFNYQVQAAQPVSELIYAGGGYATPVLGASGLQAFVNGSYSRSRPGSSLKDLDIFGHTANVTAGLSYPVILRRDRTLIVRMTLDAMDATTDISTDRLYKDKLRSARFSGALTFMDRFFGLNTVSMTASKGMNILGARETGSSDLSRAAGRSDYSKIEAVISRYQKLPLDMGFYAALQGQYTHDPLLASEEFGFGGDLTGRGYDPSELVGDKGVALRLELNKTLRRGAAVVQPYIFYDIGKIWNIDPGASNSLSAASAGGGVRIGFDDAWSCNVAAAFPLTRAPGNGPTYASGRSARIMLNVTRKF